MQNQRSSRVNPHRRPSGSFDPSISAPLISKRNSTPRRNSASLPFAQSAYVRSSGAVYSGGEKSIFRNYATSRRNIVVVCVIGAICGFMLIALISFGLGKSAGLAEADTTQPGPTAQASLATNGTTSGAEEQQQ